MISDLIFCISGERDEMIYERELQVASVVNEQHSTGKQENVEDSRALITTYKEGKCNDAA